MVIKATGCAVSSITLAIVGWVSKFDPQTVDLVFKGITGLGSIITAFFACRYYIIMARDKKK